MSAVRHTPIAIVCALGLALAGCGGSASKSSSAASATSTQTTTTATTAARATPKPHRRPAKHAPSKTSTSTSTSNVSAVTTTPSVSVAPPDGLRPGGSYGSYDNCMGSCGGSVPASLERSLHLPSGGCPVAGAHVIAGMRVLGNGPVGPVQPASLSISSFIGSSWSGGRATWVAAPSYHGPVLIRGREVGGPHAVGFGSGHVPDDQLQVNDSSGPASGGARQWPDFTRVRGRGCYAYQVDGTSFSTVIVFRAG